eukprot:14358498-Alexandrium_andersonii.AAC.1
MVMSLPSDIEYSLLRQCVTLWQDTGTMVFSLSRLPPGVASWEVCHTTVQHLVDAGAMPGTNKTLTLSCGGPEGGELASVIACLQCLEVARIVKCA